MNDRLDALLGRVAAAWVDAARRRAGLAILACLALTAVSLFYASRELGVNADTDVMLSPELPFRVQARQLAQAFPDAEDNLAVLVEASSPARASRAADALAERLEAHRELFHEVFVPGGGPFFERNGLLYLDVEELEELADRLAAAQPFLAELARDPSLPTLLALLERAVEHLDETAFAALDLPATFEEFSIALAGDGATGASFSWESWALGSDLGPSSPRRVVLVRPRLDPTRLDAAAPALEAIRGAAEEVAAGDAADLRVRVTGDAALSAEEMQLVRRQAFWAGIAAFVLVAALLWESLRSLRTAGAIVVTLACGLTWTMGFAAAAVGHLNLISINGAVLFTGLGVDFGIHFAMRYRELRVSGEGPARALRASGTSVGSSLILCALTTAIGFYAFVPTDYAGVAELGVIAGTGMFLSLVATLTLLPALLGLMPRGARAAIPPAWLWVRWMPTLPLRRPRLVLAVTAAAAIGAILLLPRVRFDANPLNVRDPDAESVRAMQVLLEEPGATPWTAELVAADLEEARGLARRLERLEPVERVLTLDDFVPQEQEEKLELLGDVALFLGPLAPAAASGPDSQATQRALRELEGAIERRLAGAQPEARLRASLHRLAAAAAAARARLAAEADPERAVAGLEARLLGELPEWLARLDRALGAEPVELADLPPQLRRRYLAPDGRARVQVVPRGDATQADSLERFVAAVQEVAPDAAGGAVGIVESGRAIVRALREALFGALGAIALLLLLLWRSVRDTLLVLTPLSLAALFTAATSAAVDLPFNFADVIVLPLLLGIGVDSGIHLVHRHREHVPTDRDVLHTGTARAVFFSALTTISSFGLLAFSTHRGIASLGQLLALGVTYTLVANLVVLPALLEAFTRRRARSP